MLQMYSIACILLLYPMLLCYAAGQNHQDNTWRCISHSLTPAADTGANASAEEAEEAVEDADVKVNNIVSSFRLQSTSFDKKGYLVYLKGYMKAVKAKLQEKGAPEEEITAFEKGASKYVKEKLLPNFKDFEFYTGESMNPDGLYVFSLHLHPRRSNHRNCMLIRSLVLSSSTTARMVSPPTSLSGSTAFLR